MSSLVEQLSEKAAAIFDAGETSASASEKEVNLQLMKTALSDLDQLFNEAIWKMSDRVTSRDLLERWQGVCKAHIHSLDKVIALREQHKSSSQSQRQPLTVTLPFNPRPACGNNDSGRRVQQASQASAVTDQNLQTSALQKLKQHSDQKQWISAAKVIRDNFAQNSQLCSSAVLPYATDTAKALTQQGNHIDSQWLWKGLAEGLGEKFGMKDQRVQEAARQLIRVFFKQNMLGSATRSAQTLLRALVGEPNDTVNAVKLYALLAACYYKVNSTDEILRAEPYAQLVWNKNRNEDVMELGAESCAGVVLVRAAILRRDHQQATTIWRTMLANKQQERAFGRCTAAQVQETKNAWLELADCIEADAKRFVNATQWTSQNQFSQGMERLIRIQVKGWS